MKRNYIATALIALAFIAFTAGFAPAYADYGTNCTTQYGGNTTCNPQDVTINKEVKNKDNVFVENLTATDTTFAPETEVHFRLTIKNASGETFKTVEVKDILPAYLTFVAGPGNYDSATRTLTFTLDNMTAGESRQVEVVAKVVPKGQLPEGMNALCMNNYAEVRVQGRFDSDTAQMCVQTNVLGVTTLPVAGYNDFLLILPFATLALAGVALLKKRV